jgi:hypothetical protein
MERGEIKRMMEGVNSTMICIVRTFIYVTMYPQYNNSNINNKKG